jgi:hypothetical protein
LSDSAFLGLGLLAAAVGGAIQYSGWAVLRANLRRWVMFAIGWQFLVLLIVGVYVAVASRGSHSSAAWIAPVVGLVVGTALPLQIVAASLLRSLTRL